MVERAAGISRDDKILELGGVEGNLSADEIGKRYLHIGVLKTHDISSAIFGRLRLICRAALDEPVEIVAVHIEPFGLPERGALGVRNTQPPEAVNDILLVLFFVAFGVRILEAQIHRAAVVRGKQVIKERSAGAPDVELTGRRRRKTCDDLIHTESRAD